MKKIAYILLLVCSLSLAQSRNEMNQPRDNCYFGLSNMDIRIQNNRFSEINKVKKVTNDKLPIEYNLTVIGKKINLKIVNFQKAKDIIREGQLVLSNLDAIKYLYKIENLEIQIVKNNKIVKKWTLVSQTQSYNDSILGFYNKKIHNETGHFFYSDSLVKGDLLDILFRKKGQKISLKLHIQKKESAKKPFITTTISEDLKEPKNFENFIQESIDKLYKCNFFNRSNFYDDWPEDYAPRIVGNTNRHFKSEKFCLVFRKPNKKERTKDSFEYRISINSKTSEWIKSNGIIFMELKESDAQYKLEVRYKDEPQNVAVYKWFTEPDWYQTVWFKITIGMISLLIFSLIYIFWMRKITKRKRLEQKAKIKMLYAQLNPHFVFNALGSIQGLLNDNQIEKANQYLVGFSSLLRNTLTSSEKETQSLELEIKTINNYIDLELLRNPFVYDFSIDENINPYEVEIIPLLMQPLIENAIKYGISNKKDAKIALTISKKMDDLIFELTDNGKGFDILAEQKGFGLKLVKDRIMLFNQSSKKMKIDINIQSNTSGTKISICYKNWLNND